MLRKFWDWVVLDFVGKLKWEKLAAIENKGKYFKLTDEDRQVIRSLLAHHYFVIVTRRKTHLSTYLIGLGGLILRGKMDYWSHALMNAEDVVQTDEDFRLIEATGTGVHYSTFEQVFDCDSVALLIPRGFNLHEWSLALEDAAKQIGKGYDTVFNFLDDTNQSCIELVRHALRAVPDYEKRFAQFEALLKKYGKLTPDMLYNCEDFNIVYEIRR